MIFLVGAINGLPIPKRSNLIRISFLGAELPPTERIEMPDEIPTEYREILNQLHSDIFLQRLTDHLDPDGKSDLNENVVSDLNNLVRRLLVEDASSPIDSEVFQNILGDDEVRDDLLKATRNIMNSYR